MKKGADKAILNKREISAREKFSGRTILSSVIIFILSLITYISTDDENILGFSGFLMIIFGSIIILFVIVYLIFYFLENSKFNKQTVAKKPKKKISKKRK